MSIKLNTILFYALMVLLLIISVYMFRYPINRNNNAKQYVLMAKRANNLGYAYKDKNKIIFHNDTLNYLYYGKWLNDIY